MSGKPMSNGTVPYINFSTSGRLFGPIGTRRARRTISQLESPQPPETSASSSRPNPDRAPKDVSNMLADMAQTNKVQNMDVRRIVKQTHMQDRERSQVRR